MTPHDRWLEPDEDDEPIMKRCQRCFGLGYVTGGITRVNYDCPDCEGSGQAVLTEAEIQQKAFDDFDPPDNDYGGD